MKIPDYSDHKLNTYGGEGGPSRLNQLRDPPLDEGLGTLTRTSNRVLAPHPMKPSQGFILSHVEPRGTEVY